MVLAVGVRAPRPDDAERDWISVLLDPGVRLGRTDETISPAGARARLVWRRAATPDRPNLEARLLAKTTLVVDDVGSLAPRLKSGDIDYALFYRTTCQMQDIRFIRLAPEPRLAPPETGSEVIRYALSIPRGTLHERAAQALVRRLLQHDATTWEAKGFTLFRPLFYGTPQAYAPFRWSVSRL